MDNDLLAKFDKSAAAFSGSRLRKALCRPVRIAKSVALQGLAGILKRPIRVQAPTFWGGSMQVALPEHVSTVIYRRGYFEEELSRYLLTAIRPGAVFFDVGAHFGYYTLLAAHLAGEGGQVHAFEPTPSTYEILVKNAQAYRNVRLNNVAVHSAAAELELRDFGVALSAFNSLGNPRLSAAEQESAGNSHCIRVKTIALDDYCARHNVSPTFVKIDAEGAEADVIAGMRETIVRAEPTIAMEVGDVGEGIGASRALVSQLMAMGYRPFEVRRGTLCEHVPSHTYGYDNLIFLH